MKVICGIYKITSPSKKIYIGQSVNILNRWSCYRNLKHNKQTIIARSLKKYGWQKHKFEIVEECLREELNEKEKYYVDLFQSFNQKFGMNARDGGGNNGIMSDETKKKIGNVHKGKIPWNKGKKGLQKHTEEWKAKMSLLNKGENNKFFGKKHTKETIEKVKQSALLPERIAASMERLRKINSGEIKFENKRFSGGSHSKETKQRISESVKKTKNGETN